ncbi:MAG TPA: YggS family pyridoxal phosphate-dependent enzyme [Steroidobacteraceae bacterium]|jgi:pyridoxal phosphate enzyme (YggS family)|nr:YggS family pyridoxal phosphate-dependent enzyme [Steroidobacteraceae bacterium]
MLSLPQNCSESVPAAQKRIAEAARAAGRSVDSVTLLAVSKGQSSAAIDSAASAGIEHFGENFLQEGLPKIEALAGRELTWHFIGRLQANKTRPVAENFAWVHAIDRFKIAERLSAQRPYHAPPLNVCLQLHVGGEASKGGVPGTEMRELAGQVSALPRLRLRGLMCMPPAESELARQRQWFRETRQLFDYLNEHGFGLDTLSMGTTSDFEAAILEGSTMVRIGTAIFGPRRKQDKE